MNKKGTRATNGEGYVGTTIQKIKKQFDNSKMCSICMSCTNRSMCNNRIDWTKCEKCKNCKEECLKYCDRFYCRKMVQAQITIDGKQVSVASKRTRKESIEEKKRKESDVLCGTYVKKDNRTVYHFCKEVEAEKIAANKIKQSTQNRNNNTFDKIKNADFFSKSIQKTTKADIDNFMSQYTYLSQSELDKISNIIKSGFERAMENDVITYKQNFMKNYCVPRSEKQEKEVVAFELEDFITLMKYVLTTNKLIKNSKCNYDSRTIRNIIILSFLSLTRIGEMGALDINKHIDLQKKYISIERTLTEDVSGKVIMGTTTKTGNRQKKVEKRIINFNIFSEELYFMVIKDQIENSRNNINNTENLLFCDKNGNYIVPSAITNIFKRICREAGIKADLITGCFIHMTRHTAISFMISLGYDLVFITSFSGHSSIKEIERTYGHILNDYRKKKLEDPNFHYEKEDIITKEIINLAQKCYLH